MIFNLNQFSNCAFFASFLDKSSFDFHSRYGKLFLYKEDICIEFFASKSSTNIFCEIYDLEIGKKISLNSLIAKSAISGKARQFYKEFSSEYDPELKEIKHQDYEVNLAYYLFILVEKFSLDLKEELSRVNESLQDLSEEKKELIYAIVKGEKPPIYYALRIEEDPKIMGVDYPQINGIEKTVEDDHLQKYKDQSDEVKFEDLDLDVFFMKIGSNHTHFYSAYYLKSEGLFVNEELKEMLQAYSLNGAAFSALTVNKKYPEKRDLFFLRLKEDQTIINFSKSTFLKKFSASEKEEITFQDFDSYKKAVQDAYEKMENFRIVSDKIYLVKYPDLLRFPLSNIVLVSRNCAQLLANQKATGYKLILTDFEIQ